MYEVYDRETGKYETVSLRIAALMSWIDEAEILWAIEEHGFCFTDDHEIRPTYH